MAHAQREPFASRFPVHLTLRLVTGLPSMRCDDVVAVLRGQIAQSHRTDFRLVQFNIQPNHLHFISEAEGQPALSRGVQGMKVRFARRLNRLFGRSGRVFEDRYHARALRTPQEVRNGLRYVLNNERHHAYERGELLDRAWIDPYSSAPWFDGWRDGIAHALVSPALLALPAPTAPSSVWLLTTGWRRHGLIAFDEVPGVPARKQVMLQPVRRP